MKYIFHLVRFLVGAFFIFSGVVKGIDPSGTGFKMTDYFTVFTEYLPFLTGLWDFLASISLPIAIFMIVLEIALGVSLILGTLPSLTLWSYAGLILFFTILTGFTAITNEVTDCGCFGDFLKLEPLVSFAKDIVLSVLIIFLIIFKKYLTPLFNARAALITLGILTLAALGFNLRNYYDLPIVDFRPYHVGADLVKGKSTEGLDPGKKEIYYTMINENGETKVMEKDEYISSGIWKDKSWKVKEGEKKEKVIREAELPKIKDFIIENAEAVDIADSLLAKEGYHFFVASYYLDKANKEGFKIFNAVIKEAAEDSVTAAGITAASIDEANKYTEGLYEFNNLDAIPIKTMIRANPGLVLIKDGVIQGKWHYNNVPSWTDMKAEVGIK